MSNEAATPIASRPRPLIERITSVPAMAAGVLLLAISLLVTASVLMRSLAGSPIPGDFEYVQMGTALVVFACLPYCQSHRGNIVVDMFTSGLSSRTIAWIDATWDIVYAIIIGIICWTMIHGTTDSISYGETTMVSQIKVWPALAISTALCAFLSIVAIWSAIRLIRRTA